MAKRELPDQALLLKLLRYEPETGRLYWRERDASLFTSSAMFNSDQQAEIWNKRYANREAFTASYKGYRLGAVLDVSLKAHRVIWCMNYGDWPECIDHVNQNRSDNRLENLRSVTKVENGRNCALSPRNRSGRIGVHWSPRDKIWRAVIRGPEGYIRLGHFKSFEAASEARLKAERDLGYSPHHGRKKR